MMTTESGSFASDVTVPSPARMDEAMPSAHAGFKVTVTGSPDYSLLSCSAPAPKTTTTGRQTDARAVSAA